MDIEGGRYTWSYDLHGRLSELDYPNGVVFTAAYSSQAWPAQTSYASADTQIELLPCDSGLLTAHTVTLRTPSPS